ncbi:hypothetical protein IRB23M11_17440 [Alkalibacterium sp. m-11]
MKPMLFEPPTDHYDERIAATDEQICQLIKQRKELSDNNPGFPTEKHITDWSKKYDFEEDFLNYIFVDLLNEDLYKPVVEPKNFIKNTPVMKAFENDDTFYSVTFVSQFENASVVHLTINSHFTSDESEWDYSEHSHFELSIRAEASQYKCRNEGGGGTLGNETFTFIVSPALPDDVSKYKLVFKEYKMPFKKETGFEVVI